VQVALRRSILDHAVIRHMPPAGATLHEGEAVTAWRPTPDGGVRVETQAGVYTARRLVLTAGAWLPELVPALQVQSEIGSVQEPP
jgi:sarcosine oxidase